MEKVLFISNHAGFSKFNKPYINYLANNGVKVFNASPGSEDVMNCVQIDIDVSRNPISLLNLKAFCKLLKLVRNENILNVNCHTPSGGLIGRFLKLLKPQLKVIYTTHGFHFYKGAPFHYWIFYFLVELLLAPLTQAIITINNEDYNISKRFFKRKTYKINGVGIDLNRFKPSSDVKKSGRAILNINDKQFVLIYTAQFISRKNHIFLLNAFYKYIQIC
jgi:glycosyltransferase EpsD